MAREVGVVGIFMENELPKGKRREVWLEQEWKMPDQRKRVSFCRRHGATAGR